MKTIRQVIAALTSLPFALVPAFAGGGNGTVAGLSLLESPSARASALGESLVAGSDDIAALGYNPAALATLRSGHASFLYQKGIFDDSYGHFLIGSPSRRGGMGLSIGFYDGGEFEMSSGSSARTVTAQRDLVIGLSTARRYGRVSFGTTAKYISSEIAETASATAYAADLGLSVAATPRLRLGAAVQNVGTRLKYADSGDELPRMARLGGALSFRPAGLSASVLFDGTYRMVEKEFEPAAGLEVGFGVLALRVGYRGGDRREFTAGTGFYAGRASFDYAFGMTASDLDASHRLSYSLRYGGRPTIANELARRPPARPRAAVEVTSARIIRRVPRTYEVKPGDSLASIAREHYGDSRLWRDIHRANSHLISDATRVEPGQKLVLP